MFKSLFKKCAVFALALTVFSAGASSQIVTASEFFNTISSYYATIKDYQANVGIKIDKEEMSAQITFLQPNLMRMDFSNPATQTILFNGDVLTVYLPDSQVVLTQNANAGSSPNTLATADGLALLKRYYSVSYETSQDEVPLEEDSTEMVVSLLLWRKAASEPFRKIKVLVNPKTKLIRRVIAETPAGVVYQLDYTDYEINQGLTAQRFQYDIPAAANNYDNFLFQE